MIVTLDKEQRTRAWSLAYQTDLDALPNSEIQAEVEIWTLLGVPAMARIGTQLLADREQDAFVVDGGARTSDLVALWLQIDQVEALRLATTGMCVVSAMRLAFAMERDVLRQRS